MRMSLRVRLLGTIIGAIVLFFLISIIAARVVLQNDLMDLGKTEVNNGAGAFDGYWDSRKDQIKLLVAQDAVSDTIRKNLQSHSVAALADQLSNIARASNLSFLTIVDNNGNVVARANGTTKGTLKSDKLIQRALTGETVSTATLLNQTLLAGEGLGAQAQSDVRGADGKAGASHIDQGLALVAVAPISDQNERTIGAIYGGVLMNHYYDLVDQATKALGGSAALLQGDAIVASTIIQQPDGTRMVDQQVGPAAGVVKDGTPYTNLDTEGGTTYLVHIGPIQDDQNTIIGARWYGFPISRITGIINDMTKALVFWGVIAMVILLAIAIPIVQRLSNTLSQQSKKVRTAAKELGVIVVGSEVSGDHVAATKAAVEKAGSIIETMGGDGKVTELKALNEELQSDMIVIDTLSQEMSNRMKQAVNRVEELNDVAGHLNELVTGESS